MIVLSSASSCDWEDVRERPLLLGPSRSDVGEKLVVSVGGSMENV